MPRCVPENPQFQTESERHVWQHLRDRLRPQDVLLSGVRLRDHRQDHEVDLAVLMPGVGAVVVEVKGAGITHDGRTWRMRRDGGDEAIDPVRQVSGNTYVMRGYVENDPRWQRTRFRWAHALVLPYTTLADGFALPDCPRWAVHDAGDMPDLVQRLGSMPAVQESGQRVPDADDVDLVVDILHGRHLPQRTVAAEARERADVADRLTAEQEMLLKVTRLLNRVEVRGGAGSGKTWLALQQAKELTRGTLSEDRRGKRIALVCYSQGLAAYFRRQVAGWDRKHRPAFVGTFHQLGRLWGAPEGSRTDSDFWERRLPAQMADLAAELPPGKRFDAVIVDEAQDVADTWWQSLLGCLKDPDTGGLYVYSDENQRIFARFGRPPVPLVPLVLDHNLRNTRQIARTFSSLTPMKMQLRGGEGPEVRFVPCTPGDAVQVADDEVDTLFDEGWQPGDIALLTTGHRHPVQLESGAEHDPQGYWDGFWDTDNVFYGHVLGFKGLERRAVVLCLNEESVRERSTERLYVGMSRATDHLVVVGDPDLVREMGGEDVARRLGIALPAPGRGSSATAGGSAEH